MQMHSPDNPYYNAVKAERVVNSCKTEEHKLIALEWTQGIDIDKWTKVNFYIQLKDLRNKLHGSSYTGHTT